MLHMFPMQKEVKVKCHLLFLHYYEMKNTAQIGDPIHEKTLFRRLSLGDVSSPLAEVTTEMKAK